MKDPTNKTASIKLGGKTYTLYFNLNTFSAFEEASGGQFFLDFLMEMKDALVSAAGGSTESLNLTPESAEKIIRKLSSKKVRALLWAALHTYDANDEPVWPFTIGKLSQMVDVNNLHQILTTLWAGANENMPEAKPEEGRPTNGVPAPLQQPENGGEQFGPSDEDVLASLETVSAD